MSSRAVYATPAERARGCTFAERFVSAGDVVRNGGSIVGAPEICNGLDCNAAGSVRYDSNGGAIKLGKSGTVFIRLRVDSGANSGRFFGSNDLAVGSFAEFRSFTSLEENLQIIIPVSDGTLVTLNIASAVDPYVFGEVMSLAATWDYSGGDTTSKAYRNSVLKETKVSSAKSVTTPDNYVTLGEWNGLYFDGEIFECKFFDVALTDQEIADLHNNTTYEYRNETSLYLPMGMSEHDPDNVRTLDISGNGRHATFGDGVTPSTFPTKDGRRHGYGFDGGDYFRQVGTGIFNGAGYTIAAEFTPYFTPGDGTNYRLYDSSQPSRFLIYLNGAGGSMVVYAGGKVIGTVVFATYSPYWREGARNLFVVTGVTGDNNAWLNGQPILVGNNTAWINSDTPNLYIAASNAADPAFSGEYHSFRVWRKALTPLQVLDLYLKTLGTGGQV